MNIPLSDAEIESFLPESSSEKTGIHELLINVLGASFSITAGEDPAYMEEVLSQYRTAVNNTQDMSGMKDPLKIAILTGFLLCDEINRLKMQNEQERVQVESQHEAAQEFNRITRNLIDYIDLVIEDTSVAND